MFLIIVVSTLLLGACATTANEEVVAEEEPEQVTEVEETPEPEVVEETSEEFVASEELKVETFQKVESVIEELNSLISSRNYEGWLTHLTSDYVDYYGSSEELDRASQTDRLKNNGVVLGNLQDYFTHVVVPSRANLRLDDLVFKDEDEVEAIMVINGRRYSVYKLRLIENEWKIDS